MTSQMTFVRVLVEEVLSAEFTFIGPFASVSLYYLKKLSKYRRTKMKKGVLLSCGGDVVMMWWTVSSIRCTNKAFRRYEFVSVLEDSRLGKTFCRKNCKQMAFHQYANEYAESMMSCERTGRRSVCKHNAFLRYEYCYGYRGWHESWKLRHRHDTQMADHQNGLKGDAEAAACAWILSGKCGSWMFSSYGPPVGKRMAEHKLIEFHKCRLTDILLYGKSRMMDEKRLCRTSHRYCYFLLRELQ